MNSTIINITFGNKHYRVTCDRYSEDSSYGFIIHQISVTDTPITKGKLIVYLGSGVRNTLQECLVAAVTNFVTVTE